jgi:hypothetical protein
MRSLAAFYDRVRPDVLAVCEIDAGDALALATRFALQWAYRGGQAVFWLGALRATGIRDNYLPFSPVRPFERRGIVEVTMQIADAPATILATHVAAEREQRIREVRHLRTVARGAHPACIVFAVMPASRIELGGLGFTRAGCRGVDNEALYVRGYHIEQAADDVQPHRGIGTPLVARLRPIQPG